MKKRIAAMILAMTMVAGDAGLSFAAETTGVETLETVTQETEGAELSAETEVPATEVPEAEEDELPENISELAETDQEMLAETETEAAEEPEMPDEAMEAEEVTATGLGETVGSAETLTIGTEKRGTVAARTEKYIKITTDATDSFYYMELRNTSDRAAFDYILYADADCTEAYRSETGNVAWSLGAKETAPFKLGKLTPNRTYYLKISSGDSEEVKYSVYVTKKQDDRPDAIEKAAAVGIGKTVTGVSEDPIDVEYFKITADKTDSFYYMTLKNLSASGKYEYTLYSDRDCTEIYKSETGNVDWSLGSKETAQFKLGKLRPGKTYYLRIASWDSMDVKYSINVTKKNDDRPDTIEKAAAAGIGKTVTGVSEDPIDVEYFKITADKTDSFYYMTLKNLSASGKYEYTLYSDRDCTEIYKSETGNVDWSLGSKETAQFKLGKLKPGKTYYLRITSWDSMDVKYSINVTKKNDDYPDAIGKASQLKFNATKKGKIEDDIDVEYFTIKTDGSKDAYYYLEMKNTSGNGKLEYALYEDKDCTRLAKDYKSDSRYDIAYDLGGKETETFCLGKISKKKTFYLKLTGSANTAYSLKAAKSNDTVANSGSSAKMIKMNAKAASYAIENYKDVDVFKFTTTSLANHTFTIKNASLDSINVEIYTNKKCSDKYRVFTGNCAGRKSLVVKKLNDNKQFGTGKTYYVKLTAGGYRDYTVAVSAPAPSKFAVKAIGGKKVKLSWKKDASAKGYYVYRATSKNGKYKKVKTVTKNTVTGFTDSKLKKGQTYYYKLVACGKKGTSAETAVKTVKAK